MSSLRAFLFRERRIYDVVCALPSFGDMYPSGTILSLKIVIGSLGSRPTRTKSIWEIRRALKYNIEDLKVALTDGLHNLGLNIFILTL